MVHSITLDPVNLVRSTLTLAMVVLRRMVIVQRFDRLTATA